MLPALQHIEYEKVNFEQHLSTLEELDEGAKTDPMFYSWVNITCHPEWLKYFDVDQFSVPTVIFYYPEKEIQSKLIGKFDNSTIADQQEKYMKGKLATWKPKVSHHAMKTEETDCSRPLEEAVSDE